MTSDDITRKQATEINQALRPTLGYLYRLRERMIKKGFVPSDSYYASVEKAYNALHELTVATHYMTCNGTGRPARDD